MDKIAGFGLLPKAESIAEVFSNLNAFLSDERLHILVLEQPQLLYFGRHKVDNAYNLKFEIYSNGHLPAHFNVKGKGCNASFDILTGELISGNVDDRQLAKIVYWYERARPKLVSM